MAVQFCADCGDLLPVSDKPQVSCECCGKITKNELLGITTTSATDDFPSELRRKRGVVNTPVGLSATDTWPTTDTACRRCGAGQVKYTALQLRGADEGTTLFYFCAGCSERWGENN